MTADESPNDLFELHDLRVEVIESERPFVMHVKKGDYFDVIGGRVVFPQDRPEFSLYGLLAVLPFIPAKQRPTHPNDWMTSDCLIAATDPACGARFRISRFEKRSLRHADFSVVPLGETNASEPRHSLSTVHAVSRLCQCPPHRALEFLSTAKGMARWNLGLWHTREVEPGLFTGESLFGGGSGWVRVRLDREAGRIDYRVGESRTQLVSRIEARVQDAAALGFGVGQSMVTLTAWRTADMTDERWQRLTTAHETEIELIRSVLEQGPQPDTTAEPPAA